MKSFLVLWTFTSTLILLVLASAENTQPPIKNQPDTSSDVAKIAAEAERLAETLAQTFASLEIAEKASASCASESESLKASLDAVQADGKACAEENELVRQASREELDRVRTECETLSKKAIAEALAVEKEHLFRDCRVKMDNLERNCETDLEWRQKAFDAKDAETRKRCDDFLLEIQELERLIQRPFIEICRERGEAFIQRSTVRYYALRDRVRANALQAQARLRPHLESFNRRASTFALRVEVLLTEKAAPMLRASSARGLEILSVLLRDAQTRALPAVRAYAREVWTLTESVRSEAAAGRAEILRQLDELELPIASDARNTMVDLFGATVVLLIVLMTLRLCFGACRSCTKSKKEKEVETDAPTSEDDRDEKEEKANESE